MGLECRALHPESVSRRPGCALNREEGGLRQFLAEHRSVETGCAPLDHHNLSVGEIPELLIN